MCVAYFPDSYNEINGVAHTSRQFEAFARRRDLPFLMVRAGERSERYVADSRVASLELKRGFLSFALEKDLRIDLGFLRHLRLITQRVKAFKPDVIHITGPSELGFIGSFLALWLRVPLVASWHTNVHEYAAKRSTWLLRHVPESRKAAVEERIERLSLFASAKFYSIARLLFAPNLGLCRLLEQATRRPCLLMKRGVDTDLFSPAHRSRPSGDTAFVLGFVGRLSIEKNVELLAEVQQKLTRQGVQNFRFLIVGQGAEEQWLREHLPGVELPGVLRGESLSRAYANMDLFVFPSHTDTFGNVVLEALASGVPAIVTPDGGPPSIILPGETGLVARDEYFAAAVYTIMSDPGLHERMRHAARQSALGASWDSVFESVYEDGYQTAIDAREVSWTLPRATVSTSHSGRV